MGLTIFGSQTHTHTQTQSERGEKLEKRKVEWRQTPSFNFSDTNAKCQKRCNRRRGPNTHNHTHTHWHPLTSFHSHKDVQINMTGAGLNPKIVQSEMNAWEEEDAKDKGDAMSKNGQHLISSAPGSPTPPILPYFACVPQWDLESLMYPNILKTKPFWALSSTWPVTTVDNLRHGHSCAAKKQHRNRQPWATPLTPTSCKRVQ